MKLDPNEVNGYYDSHYHRLWWLKFTGWWKNIDWSDFWATIGCISIFAVPILLIYFIYGSPNKWDANIYYGPVTQHVHATINHSDYCSNCTQGNFDVQTGLSHDSFTGSPNGRYTATLANQEKIVEVGDKVILNLNTNGDVLTFVDVTAGHRYCVDRADCDY